MKQTLLATAVLMAFAGTAPAAELTYGQITVDGQSTSDASVLANTNNQTVLIEGSGATEAVFSASTDFTVLGQDITLKNTSGEALRLDTSGTGVIGNANTKKVTIVGVDGLNVIAQKNGPQLTVNSNELVINASNAGIWVQAGAESNPAIDPHTILNINAQKTTINADNYGIIAFSNSEVNVKGDLTVTAKHAIDTRGYATVNINQNGNSTVVLNGDIVFETPGSKEGSGQAIDANVNINLNTEGSSWKGNVKKSYPTENADKPNLTEVTKLNVSLSNGAQWTPTVHDLTPVEGQKVEAQSVNQLNLNGGVINVTKELVDANQTVDLDKVTGTGGTINTHVATDAAGNETAGKVNVKAVESASGTPAFNVVASNVTSDKMTDKTLETLGKSVAVENGTADSAKVTATVKEGAVNGAVSQTFDGTGTATGEAVEAKNTKLDAYSSVVSLGAFTWRHDMNDLTKRMGELRLSPEKTGSWARVYGSELNYGAQNVRSKQNSVQVGTDFDLGNGWKVGGAFSYTDGTATYSAGEADNKAYGLAAYGSWFGEDGQFVDLIAKYSRLSSDFTLGDMGGDYDNNAFSVSAEYGWHFRLNDVAFVEPQAELTYGRIMGDEFTSTNGARVAQEDFDSLIGRLGVRAGFYFPKDRGTVYARASVLHDFQGEAESKVTLVDDSSVASTLKDDLGGTWYEFGLGANFNLTDTTYVYVDLERTNAGKVVEDYRWNVGVRHAW